jgi:hypothetical protein
MAQRNLMCGKCDEINEKIAHHNRLLSGITDRIARDSIAGLIEETNAEKAGLHPKPEEQ